VPKKPTIKELAADINKMQNELQSVFQGVSTLVSVFTDYMKFKGDTEAFHDYVSSMADNDEAAIVEND
tara:strand:+ start:483 stop:686 length:204 start_codon:yes stop_codon:yes gene_type:complete